MAKQETDKPLPEKPGTPDKAETGAKKGIPKRRFGPPSGRLIPATYTRKPRGRLAGNRGNRINSDGESRTISVEMAVIRREVMIWMDRCGLH